jgi:hypothetical protein
VFLRKLRDLCLSMFLVQRPEALQFMLVNGARGTCSMWLASVSNPEQVLHKKTQ